MAKTPSVHAREQNVWPSMLGKLTLKETLFSHSMPTRFCFAKPSGNGLFSVTLSPFSNQHETSAYVVECVQITCFRNQFIFVLL